MEAAKKGTPQNVGFDTPFLTGERVQSVRMNFSIEKTGNDISGDDHYYSEEDAKMVWMCEARIRMFMQLELEASLEEINWRITCHNGENSPQERPRASEEEETVVANATPSTDEGGDFISQTEVEMDHEPLQLGDRHFELVIFRQQHGTTAKSTDWGGDCPVQADLAGSMNTMMAAQDAAGGCNWPASARGGVTDQKKQYD